MRDPTPIQLRMPCGHPYQCLDPNGGGRCLWCADRETIASIKVHLADTEAIAKLPPAQIRAYLQHRNWRRFLAEEAWTWWEHPDLKRQVLVPAVGRREEAGVLQHLVRVVAEVEARSELAVYLDMLSELELP